MSANTSLHAGFSRGWPHDHKAEDGYEAPPHTWAPGVNESFRLLAEKKEEASMTHTTTTWETGAVTECASPEYRAEFGTDGSARLYLHAPKTLIGSFDTFADAQLAAEALNNHKGY
jgi:hypothetical protein